MNNSMIKDYLVSKRRFTEGPVRSIENPKIVGDEVQFIAKCSRRFDQEGVEVFAAILLLDLMQFCYERSNNN